MVKASTEIQHILDQIRVHIMKNLTDEMGFTIYPYGSQCLFFENKVHRLLVLEGKIQEGQRVYHDPFLLYLAEYATDDFRMVGISRNFAPYFLSEAARPPSIEESNTTPVEMTVEHREESRVVRREAYRTTVTRILRRD